MKNPNSHMTSMEKLVALLVEWMLWVARRWVVHTIATTKEMVDVVDNYEVAAL